MHCPICKRPEEEVKLYDGILASKVSKICESCANREGIPILKKPTQEQLAIADKRYSVRERMERLSSPHANPSDISQDQITAHKNLNKLRMLPKKQHDPRLFENYYWRLTLARRRKKMSYPQLAKASGVPEEIIESIEKGILPANFEQPMVKLEMTLGINLLKNHNTDVKFKRINHSEEREILKQVGEKIGVRPIFHPQEDEYMDEVDIDELTRPDPEEEATKSEKLSRLSRGELDMSKRTELQDITLSDLQNLKRERDRKKQEVQIKKQHEDMFGEDVDFEDLESV